MCSIDGSPGLSTCHGPAAFAPHSLTPASAQSPKGRRAKTSLSLLYFTSLVNSIFFFYFWHIFTLASEFLTRGNLYFFLLLLFNSRFPGGFHVPYLEHFMQHAELDGCIHWEICSPTPWKQEVLYCSKLKLNQIWA